MRGRALAILVLAAASAAQAADARTLEPERALADKYAPVVRLKVQLEPCGAALGVGLVFGLVAS